MDVHTHAPTHTNTTTNGIKSLIKSSHAKHHLCYKYITVYRRHACACVHSHRNTCLNNSKIKQNGLTTARRLTSNEAHLHNGCG
ncbi:hypothetical protein LSH36_578g01010 [Paralvinella palmiformis]|uniref:Uncharacterized protein n=1 Tax=Paralvinella palmiformis TaxID=53620 RepID=A0AAD9J771_9ANNE|nr:hypothetical protein LSH36_578g01010 [Paralvinella palmiformis]